MKRMLTRLTARLVGAQPVAEALSWKIHSYIVLEEELRPTGQDCAGPELRHDEETRRQVLDVVAGAKLPEGDVLEFGVFQGKSLRLFAECFPMRHVYGFDSFEGLPEGWRYLPKGHFKTPMPRIDEPNVTLVKGAFDESLPRFLAGWTGRAAVIHIDCTVYNSTMACLPAALSQCWEGTAVLFDEYYNYPGFAQHEWRAWREVSRKARIIAPCIAYDGRRAAFQIADPGALASMR